MFEFMILDSTLPTWVLFISSGLMDPGKLFIGGISWDTDEDRLKQYFQTYGEVVEVMIMRDRNTGRARGFGFVLFSDPVVAARVVLEKHVIDGRTVEAKKAVPRDDQNILSRNNTGILGSPGPTRTKKIFVGGLASTVTESDFKKYFDQFGTITDAVVMYDHNTQRPRGFGFITYESEESVEKVLYKTFHELNGKMVEVKRAVPKELSPVPNRNQLGAYPYSFGRVGSYLSGYNQGYNTTSVGGYGLRSDGRFSRVTVGRGGLSPISPGYGIGLNLDAGLNLNYGTGPNGSSNLIYGRVMSSSYGGNLNRYGSPSPMVYGGGSGGNGSILSSSVQNLWGNVGNSAGTNASHLRTFPGSGGVHTGTSSLNGIGGLWGVGHGENTGSSPFNGSGNVEFGNGGSVVGYGRSIRSNVSSASLYSAPNIYDEVHGNNEEGNSFYGHSSWQSLPTELEDSSSVGFGLGNAASDVISRNNASGYTVGYGVSNTQSNRGIAA
ncbi:Heterogeneous nuclear ribonucleoprotein 1, partial [Cucurbita argyrosperma subsp. sororia]